MMRILRSPVLLLVLMLCAMTGCAVLPNLPRPIQEPRVQVTGIEPVEVTEEGARFEIVLLLRNPNEIALPLALSEYTLRIEAKEAKIGRKAKDGGRVYHSNHPPNATLPAGGRIVLRLPAAIPLDAPLPARTRWRVSGSIRYHPPGALREMVRALGFPVPEVNFTDGGAF